MQVGPGQPQVCRAARKVRLTKHLLREQVEGPETEQHAGAERGVTAESRESLDPGMVLTA